MFQKYTKNQSDQKKKNEHVENFLMYSPHLVYGPKKYVYILL